MKAHQPLKVGCIHGNECWGWQTETVCYEGCLSRTATEKGFVNQGHLRSELQDVRLSKKYLEEELSHRELLKLISEPV